MEATLSGEAYAKVDDGDAATQARTTLVQRARHSGQVSYHPSYLTIHLLY